MIDHLRRGEIVAVHEGENLYDVKLTGAMYPMSRVPCLNFSNLYVGLNVVVDMSDPQCPTILSAQSTTNWMGLQDSIPHGIDDAGWHYEEGTYDHSGFLATPAGMHVPKWSIPPAATIGRIIGTPRIAAWSDSRNVPHEILILDHASSPALKIAWDTKNSYTLGAAVPLTDTAPTNASPQVAVVSVAETTDVGKVIVIYGTDANGAYVYERVQIQAGSKMGTSGRQFKRIFKIEVRKSIPVGTMGAWATLAGSMILSCGSIYQSIPAGTQIKFLGDTFKIQLVPTEGSYDYGSDVLSLASGAYLYVGNEIMQVAGVDGTSAVIGARGLYNTPVASHTHGVDGDLAMPMPWILSLPSSDGVTSIHMNIMYLPATFTKSSDPSKAQAVVTAYDVRTGEPLWWTPTYGEVDAGNSIRTLHIGVVPDKVPNPSDPLAPPEPIVVFSPADAIKWNPAESAYKNKDEETDGFEEGYIVVITEKGAAALNRRTGEKIWEEPWDSVLPPMSDFTATNWNDDNSRIVGTSATTPVSTNSITTLPSGFTVFPYYRTVLADKTTDGSPSVLMHVKFETAMCYRIINSKTGAIANTYTFNRSIYTESGRGSSQSGYYTNLVYDGGFGSLKAVPNPDGTGVDFITLLKVITEYDWQDGYPSPSTDGTNTNKADPNNFLNGLVKDGYYRIMSHRLSDDGTMAVVYDSTMNTFPSVLSILGDQYQAVISRYDTFPADLANYFGAITNSAVTSSMPVGYCNGSQAPADRRLVYLVQECGYNVLDEWTTVKYNWGVNGQITSYEENRPPGPEDIAPGGAPYELIGTVTYISRDNIIYPLGVRAVVVNPYTGVCLAASSEYLNDPSDQATEDSDGQRDRAMTDDYVNRYISLEDFKYHSPIVGLSQNYFIRKIGNSRTDKKTAVVMRVNTLNGNLEEDTDPDVNPYLSQPISVAGSTQDITPGFYNTYPGVLVAAQSEGGTLFFGREKCGLYVEPET